MTGLLDDFLRRRAAIKGNVAARCDKVVRDLLDFIDQEAERGFAVAGPVAATDPDLSRIIYRGILRRVRSKARRSVGELQGDDQAIAKLVETSERIFTNRLIELSDQRLLADTGARSQ